MLPSYYMIILCPIITVLIFLSSILIGSVLFFNPALAIRIQKKFYEKINWRIEPISMEKEIRNTKIMGLFLIIVSFSAGIYIFIKII